MARQILTIGATSYEISAAATGGTWEVAGEPNDPADMTGARGDLLRIQMLPWNSSAVFSPTVRFHFPVTAVPKFTPTVKQIRATFMIGDSTFTDGGMTLRTASGTLLQTINNPWASGVWPVALTPTVAQLCAGCYADFRFPAGGILLPTGGSGSTGVFLTSVAIDLISAIGDKTGLTTPGLRQLQRADGSAA